jgi:hypothetical protein
MWSGFFGGIETYGIVSCEDLVAADGSVFEGRRGRDGRAKIVKTDLPAEMFIPFSTLRPLCSNEKLRAVIHVL